jgi:hypothetical protein
MQPDLDSPATPLSWTIPAVPSLRSPTARPIDDRESSASTMVPRLARQELPPKSAGGGAKKCALAV